MTCVQPRSHYVRQEDNVNLPRGESNIFFKTALQKSKGENILRYDCLKLTGTWKASNAFDNTLFLLQTSNWRLTLEGNSQYKRSSEFNIFI